jgi:hypothetical protein
MALHSEHRGWGGFVPGSRHRGWLRSETSIDPMSTLKGEMMHMGK